MEQLPSGERSGERGGILIITLLFALFFIGAIGFLLDRIMLVCQRLVTFEEQTI